MSIKNQDAAGLNALLKLGTDTKNLAEGNPAIILLPAEADKTKNIQALDVTVPLNARAAYKMLDNLKNAGVDNFNLIARFQDMSDASLGSRRINTLLSNTNERKDFIRRMKRVADETAVAPNAEAYWNNKSATPANKL